jgi:hypothetical protein
MLYLVHVLWASGRSSYYCARAEDSQGALETVATMADRYPPGRTDIVTGEAFEWPQNPPCPMRNPEGPSGAFKLRSRAFVESVLLALGQASPAPSSSLLSTEAPPVYDRRAAAPPLLPPAGAKLAPMRAL